MDDGFDVEPALAGASDLVVRFMLNLLGPAAGVAGVALQVGGEAVLDARARRRERVTQLASEIAAILDPAALALRLETDEPFADLLIDVVEQVQRISDRRQLIALAQAIAHIVESGDDAQVSESAFIVEALEISGRPTSCRSSTSSRRTTASRTKAS
ncbi:MAG: hypothetical protein R2705_01515 [Ilumatobacteraceae bacterium]